MTFRQKLKIKWDQGKFVCVGLDQSDFKANKRVVDQTFDLVLAYKPQSSFYEADGPKGLKALKKIVDYIRQKDPSIPLILDAKRGDIGSTNEGYVKSIFDYLGFDAVTVSPYLGKEALQPFLERADKGIIILVKTSNPGAGEFQDLEVKDKPLYQVVAQNITKNWNKNDNCCVVVGATYPKELAQVRKIIGDMPILIPGIGAQGGDLEKTVKAGKNSKNQGMIISSSRGIIFAESPRDAALKMHQDIVGFLK